MVINGVTAAEAAIDVIHVPVAEHVVTVVVVPRDDGLDVLQFAELGQQAAVDPGRAGRLSVGAREERAGGGQGFFDFAERDMEKRQGRDGRPAILLRKMLAVSPIPT